MREKGWKEVNKKGRKEERKKGTEKRGQESEEGGKRREGRREEGKRNLLTRSLKINLPEILLALTRTYDSHLFRKNKYFANIYRAQECLADNNM